MGWKTVQSRKNKSKKIKLALVVLGLIALLVLTSQIVRFTQILNSPWGYNTRTASWDGEFNLNLVVRTQTISLLSYNPTEEKIIIVKIPDESYLNAGEFGKWQLRAIFDLGGSELLKQTLADFFGLPIDGFLNLDSPEETAQLVEVLRKNPVSGFSLLSSLKTDLTPMELLKLKQGLSAVRFDKISEINLAELDILDKTTLADGSQVFTSDPVKLDSTLTDFVDPKFVGEQKTIAIFNATEHPQLAQKASRLISNLGGRVIIVSNSKARIEKTAVYGEESATFKRIKQIFQASDTISSKDEELESSRAQINLYLGEDYYK